MHEDRIWPVKETPAKVSFMPFTGKDDEEEKGPGLPFPPRLGDHIAEMWVQVCLEAANGLEDVFDMAGTLQDVLPIVKHAFGEGARSVQPNRGWVQAEAD
jgi:hypothetical protein